MRTAEVLKVLDVLEVLEGRSGTDFVPRAP